MKKIIILFAFIFIGSMNLIAQPPQPPENASTGNPGPVGGNAPIGSGVAFLLILSATYWGKKAYERHMEKK